jgi:hypothetical protein
MQTLSRPGFTTIILPPTQKDVYTRDVSHDATSQPVLHHLDEGMLTLTVNRPERAMHRIPSVC